MVEEFEHWFAMTRVESFQQEFLFAWGEACTSTRSPKLKHPDAKPVSTWPDSTKSKSFACSPFQNEIVEELEGSFENSLNNKQERVGACVACLGLDRPCQDSQQSARTHWV